MSLSFCRTSRLVKPCRACSPTKSTSKSMRSLRDKGLVNTTSSRKTKNLRTKELRSTFPPLLREINQHNIGVLAQTVKHNLFAIGRHVESTRQVVIEG